MTEAEWMVANDPRPMFGFLDERAGERKLRLLACAVIRQAPFAADGRTMWELAKIFDWFEQKVWRYEVGEGGGMIQTHDLVAITCHEMIEIAERSADAIGISPERATAADGAFAARYHAEADTFGYDPVRKPGSSYRYEIAERFEFATGSGDLPTQRTQPILPDLERLGQPISPSFLPVVASLIREVFGNPFRPVRAEPAWLTLDVLALARGIYDDKAFDRMPILADALQDAGCDNVNVLDHCREEPEHVRGCWVIDMLLGKG